MTNITPTPENNGIPNYYGGNVSPNNSPYQQPQEFHPPQPVKPQRNRDGLISFGVSMAALLFLRGIPLVGIAAAIVGIVFGHKSMKQTKGNSFSVRSHGICGTIAGYFALVASVAFTIFFFVALVQKLAAI